MEIYPIDIAIHLVNIAILYIILRVLVWNPVSSFMKQRSDRVKGQQQKAEGLMAEAEKKNKEYDELLKNARTEGERLAEDIRKKAMEESEVRLESAKKQSQQELERVRKEAQEEKKHIIDTAGADLLELGCEMAKRVLSFDEEVRKNLMSNTSPLPEGKAEKCTVTTAEPCPADELERIRSGLEGICGVRLLVENRVNPEIVGGFIAYVGGKVYDFSYSSRLADMKMRIS